METEVVVALVGGGFGLAGTIGGTLLGMYVNGRSAVRTALQLADVEQHKYAQQKLWDARQAAYTELLAAITEMASTASALSFGWHGGNARESEFFNEEYTVDLQDSFFKQSEELRSKVNQTALVLSDECHALYDKWTKALWNPKADEEGERERYLRFDDVMERYKLLFRDLARKELISN